MTKQVMKKSILVAHAAGIIDGEGCFGIHCGAKDRAYSPVLQVVMTQRKPLDQLLGLFGGSICQHKFTEGYRQAFHYTVKCGGAVRLAEQVLPYLIEKRSQAEVMIELGKNIAEWNAKKRYRGNLPDDVIDYRSDLKNKISQLKLRPVLTSEPRNLPVRENLAYFAGLLEAEGCFSILHGPGNSFAATVTVQMCSRAVLSAIRETFAGTVIFRPKTAPHKDIYMWRVKGRLAADVCRGIAPYLSFRHEEADLLRQLQTTTDLWAKKVGRGGMPQEITNKRMRWMNRIHDIHSPNRARAETKSESAERRSDSPVCIKPSDAGLSSAACAVA